jgi:hypothetical protein
MRLTLQSVARLNLHQRLMLYTLIELKLVHPRQPKPNQPLTAYFYGAEQGLVVGRLEFLNQPWLNLT